MTDPAPIPAVDDEALVARWLAAQTPLAGTSVGDRVPENYDGTQSVITVARIGGVMDRGGGGQWLDRPRLDISCYGKDKATAKALATQVRALLAVARFDDHTGSGAVWSDTVEDVGPQWIPDTEYPQTGRYLLQVTVAIHPAI